MQLTPSNHKPLKQIKPSLFGVYPLLPRGEAVHVWLGKWLTCCLLSNPEKPNPLTLEIDTAPGFTQKISVDIAIDSEKYRDTLLSKWMQAGAPAIPKATPESILALIVSQFPGTPMPVWDNAFIHRTHWQQTLAKAGTESSDKLAALSILETLILDTPLLDLLKASENASDALLGVEHTVPKKLLPVMAIVYSMVKHIQERPGALFLSDTTRSQREFDKIASQVGTFGWLAVCGDRPAEVFAQTIADKHDIPSFQIDAQKLRRAEWLHHIDKALVAGKESNLGVLRLRAMEQHKEAISAGAFNDAHL